MKNNQTHIIKLPGVYFQVLLLILGSLGTSFAQSYKIPILPDTSELGRYTSRTMNLLHRSTPDKRNDVRILVYGQSISEQEWWLDMVLNDNLL